MQNKSCSTETKVCRLCRYVVNALPDGLTTVGRICAADKHIADYGHSICILGSVIKRSSKCSKVSFLWYYVTKALTNVENFGVCREEKMRCPGVSAAIAEIAKYLLGAHSGPRSRLL